MSEEPTFSIDNVSLQFPLNNLQHLRVQDDRMFLIDRQVHKIDLKNPSNLVRYKLPDGKVTNCWLHPNGLHLIVEMGQLYFYLHDTYTSFKSLPKFKNMNIQHIAFGHAGDLDTGNFLAVTREGHVYVALIKPHEAETKKDDKYIKQVYKVGSVVDGIHYSEHQINLFANKKQYTWDVFDPSYSQLVNAFKNTQINDIPGGDQNIFSFNHHSYIHLSSVLSTNDPELNLSHTTALEIPNVGHLKHAVITPHHLVFLAKQSLVVYNKLQPNPQVIALPDAGIFGITADFNSNTYWLYGPSAIYELVVQNEAISVWHNYYKMGKYTEALKALEEGGVKGSAVKKDAVMIKQGYHYLQEGGFGIDSSGMKLQKEGIRILARTSEPFEKICLMLLNLASSGGNTLLVEYLIKKFEIAKAERSRVRAIVLSSWIVELLLRIEDDSVTLKSFISANYSILDRKTVYQIMMDLHHPDELLFYVELIEDYEFILNYNINAANWKEAIRAILKLYSSEIPNRHEIIYQTSTVLLANAPRQTVETWLRIGSDNLDYEKLLPAILTYNKSCDTPLQQNYSIQFLSRVIYEQNVKSRKINNLFLSLLVTYPAKDDYPAKQVVKFLNHIQHERNLYDAHFILRLCLSHKQYRPAVLILLFDMRLYEQALKLALDNEMTDLAEYVLREYDGEKTGEPAITEIKLEEENFGTKKKLWLMFAKYLFDRVCTGKISDEEENKMINEVGDVGEVSQKQETASGSSVQKETASISSNETASVSSITNDLVDTMIAKPKLDHAVSKKINTALKYILHLANNGNLGVIGLKDLFPLFPDTIPINNVKDEIVKALDQYYSKISQLQFEMKESLQISANLKEQIEESTTLAAMAQVKISVEPGEPCQICDTLLLAKSPILFPNCHHGFHRDCLIRYFHKSKGNYRFKKIFNSFKKDPSAVNKKELNDVLVQECPMCNENGILEIDEALVDPEADKEEIDSWKI